MFKFWYSERCTRQIKLVLCILVCLMIYIASQQVQLGTVFVGISLTLGMLVHILRHCSLKISPQNPYREGFSRLFSFIPLIGLITLVGYLPEQQRVYLAMQCVGFSCIGFALLSIHSHRAKRF